MPKNPERLFQLPRHGEPTLPEVQRSDDKEAEAILLNEVALTERANDFLELVPTPDFWKMDFGESGQVYIKPFLQRSLYMDKPRESHVLYAMDLGKSKRVMGLVFSVRHAGPGNNEETAPFVGFNQTRADFYNLGLGSRRLVALNEMCKQIYGETLTSGEFLSNQADNPAVMIWERFVLSGLAERIGNGYRFTK